MSEISFYLSVGKVFASTAGFNVVPQDSITQFIEKSLELREGAPIKETQGNKSSQVG